jgi:hypothetical protein
MNHHIEYQSVSTVPGSKWLRTSFGDIVQSNEEKQQESEKLYPGGRRIGQQLRKKTPQRPTHNALYVKEKEV